MHPAVDDRLHPRISSRRRPSLPLHKTLDSPHPNCTKQELLSELHIRFSRNDGNQLEAIYPDLLSAVADHVPGNSQDGAAHDEPHKTLGSEENHATPVTWEEVRRTHFQGDAERVEVLASAQEYSA